METLESDGRRRSADRNHGQTPKEAWEGELGGSSTPHDPCSPNHPKTMSNYCEPLLAALKDCILHSDCVMKDGKLPSECIKHHLDELPEECRSLRLATFECKRGMVYPFLHLSNPEYTPFSCIFKLDMRKRFRGNSASATAARIKQENASPSTPPTELPTTT